MNDLLMLLECAEARRRGRPADWYDFERNPMQAAFHRAPHRLRALFPGNRSGKTTAMAVEAAWTARGTHPFLPITAHPTGQVILWIAPQYKQFEELRPQLESDAFDAGFAWNAQERVYTWPNGSRLFVTPSDRDWSYVQGINPDLVCVDEECPLPLWRELLARAPGKRRTKYVIAATATQAESWMEKEVYRVWLDHHHDLGLDEDAAMQAQAHPTMWVWPKGSLLSNPGIAEEDKQYFLGLRWSSEKEAKVRREGGFSNWIGDPVFDIAGMDWLRARRVELLASGVVARRGGLEAA